MSAATNGQKKRFIGDRKCPVCGGCESDDRGTGKRCAGFIAGRIVFCTREEHGSGCLRRDTTSPETWEHRLHGPCPCGTEHNPALKDGKIDRIYKYHDQIGKVIFEVVRFKNPKDFRQRQPNPRRGETWSIKGIKTVLYHLPLLLSADPAEPVWIVEGEKDVENLEVAGRLVTCNPMGAGKWQDSYSETLRGRHCLIVPDNDEPGRQHARQVAQSLHGKAASVKIVELPGLPDKGDTSDFLAKGGTVDQLDQLARAAPDWTPATSVSNDAQTASAAGRDKLREPRESQGQVLMRLAAPFVLWRTPEQRGYATLPVNGRSEHHEVRSTGVRRWLTRAYYLVCGKPPSAEAMQGAIGVLEAQAVFDGPEHPVYVRCAERDGSLYLDLCDTDWHVVVIDADGWRVVSDAPVRFRRPAGLLALPEPRRGGTLGLLHKHVTVKGDDFTLLVMWLVAALRAKGPYPILALTGEQGSAKCTLARLARILADPNVSPVRCEPREPRDLMISATNGWVVALDNISSIPPWLSDVLCRLATGGGFATRTLYTNEEETFLDAQRPVILNGIVDYVTRGDLIDRCLFLHLPTIPESERKSEREFWAAFEGDYPFILGALLDALSGALRVLPKIRPASLPRMADFAVWGQAACAALGWDANDFAAAYAANRRNAHETILDDSPVAGPVRQLVKQSKVWTGTPTELLGELAALAGEKVVATPRWPKSPRSLTGTLRRLAPTLRHAGIESGYVPHTRKGGQWTLAEKEGDDPSPVSHASPQPDFQGQVVTDRNGQASPTAASVTDPSPTLPGKTLGRDACDGRDGEIPTLSGSFDSEWEEGDV
jgi:hypothetical protein